MRDLPSRFSHWNSVLRRIASWYLNWVWTRLLTAVANRADLSRVHLDSSYVLAGWACNPQQPVELYRRAGGESVIPSQRNRTVPINHNRVLYWKSKIVEHDIGWLNLSRLAPRFEKTASGYLVLMMFVTVHH